MMIIDIETLKEDRTLKKPSDDHFSCVDLDFQKDLGWLFPYHWSTPPKAAYLINALDFLENAGFVYVVAKDENNKFFRSEIVEYPLIEHEYSGITMESNTYTFYHYKSMNNGEAFIITTGMKIEAFTLTGKRYLERKEALNLVNVKGQ